MSDLIGILLIHARSPSLNVLLNVPRRRRWMTAGFSGISRARGSRELRPCKPRSKAMKTIVATLIAASVFGLVALPANALDPKAFYERQDRASH